jgi:hypothetical protein
VLVAAGDFGRAALNSQLSTINFPVEFTVAACSHALHVA